MARLLSCRNIGVDVRQHFREFREGLAIVRAMAFRIERLSARDARRIKTLAIQAVTESSLTSARRCSLPHLVCVRPAATLLQTGGELIIAARLRRFA